MAKVAVTNGLSGGAGYTDPDNNAQAKNEYGRDLDGVPGDLVGYGWSHLRLLKSSLQQQRSKCKRAYRLVIVIFESHCANRARRDRMERARRLA